ncbi:MAG: indolepyruvate oxidoreductase subunit beta [Deltaproteobacteria bacterium]|nr:MAG: indolepyruvate oxidoreductase subunit beta [Deltaproteobacteria bacterium]
MVKHDMTNIIFAGVGGQGVLLAGKILMQVALDAGYDVKESEVHGMAQRGGSVDCHVRYGDTVYSPLVEKGGADYIVAFEYVEAIRKLDYLKEDGKLIVNRLAVKPVLVEAGLEEYPQDVESWIKENVKNSVLIDTKDVLKEVKSSRALNIVMLGALANYLAFDKESWEEAIKKTVKEKFVEMNLNAFDRMFKLKKLRPFRTV